MTRINLVPPEELYDQHLMAEYREIFMVPAALKRALASKNPVVLSNTFTLGTGHVRFFYDKGLYLHKRYLEVSEELRKRGFNLDSTRIFPVDVYPKEYYNDWIPTQKDLEIIRQRINERVLQKPDWYRKTLPL